MKISVFFVFLLCLLSCGEIDCNTVKQGFYLNEYNLIVEGSNINEVWIKIRGTVPITEKKTSIMVHNNWMVNFDEVEAGDTIIKRAGNLELVIHKKDTIIRHDWYCKGKPYK